ncbi:hypothetical protein AAG570_002795, partial [Ranatra chinensis]
QDNNPEAEQFRKLFIGGLDYRTTDDTLKSFYEQWGEIVDVVVMKHPTTNKSRGFGFVTYSSSQMVDQAMANRPHKIDGREVDSKRAVPRDESGRSDTNVNVKKLFVRGLKDQSEADLREYFSKYGTIVGIKIVTDKDSGNRKGYGFVEYTDYDPVDKALLYKNHSICGKSVTVRKALPKGGSGRESRGGGGRGSGGGSGRSSGGGARSSWGSGGGGDQWGGHSNSWNGGGGDNYGGPWESQSQGNWGSGNQSWGGSEQGYGGGGGGGGE